MSPLALLFALKNVKSLSIKHIVPRKSYIHDLMEYFLKGDVLQKWLFS